MSRHRPKMLTTTITRVAFAEKMKQVAEEGLFVEYKRINDYWKERIGGGTRRERVFTATCQNQVRRN